MLRDQFEHSLHIPDVIDKVREDDEIEFLPQEEVMDIGVKKCKVRVPHTPAVQHALGKINADAPAWLQGSQQISLAAAKFEDAHPWRNQKAVNRGQSRLIVPPNPFPPIEGLRELIPEALALVSIASKAVQLLPRRLGIYRLLSSHESRYPRKMQPSSYDDFRSRHLSFAEFVSKRECFSGSGVSNNRIARLISSLWGAPGLGPILPRTTKTKARHGISRALES